MPRIQMPQSDGSQPSALSAGQVVSVGFAINGIPYRVPQSVNSGPSLLRPWSLVSIYVPVAVETGITNHPTVAYVTLTFTISGETVWSESESIPLVTGAAAAAGNAVLSSQFFAPVDLNIGQALTPQLQVSFDQAVGALQTKIYLGATVDTLGIVTPSPGALIYQ